MAFSISLNQSWFVMGPQSVGPLNVPTGDLNHSIVVTVFPDWFKQCSLEWNVPSSWGACTFHIYFWPGGESEYVRLTSAPINSNHFTDPTIQEYSKFHDGYYIVEALIQDRNLRVKSDPVSWKYRRRNFVELRAAEVQRREYILLSKFVGIKSFLFRKKMYGLRCSRCWSKESEKVMDDRCPICFGTSFVGGYFEPVPVFIQYEPTPNNRQKTYFGNLEANQIGAWTISLPELCPDDIIIRSGDWNVYRVAGVASTELQTNTVRQMLRLTQLSRMDVENALAKMIQADSEIRPPSSSVFADQRFQMQQLDSNVNNDPVWFKEQNAAVLPEKYKL